MAKKSVISPMFSLITLSLVLTITVSAVLARQRLASQASAPEMILVCHVPTNKSLTATTINVPLSAWLDKSNPHASHSDDFLVSASAPCPPEQ